MQWDTVIGLEVHAQLKTKSKLFSGSSTTYGALANSQTSYIDAGLPGVLPVLNQEAVVMAIRLGLAIKADINDLSVFERKNYFYPDLPKGYQISQLQKPIISNGHIIIELANKDEKKILIERAHLEEDAGKSLHDIHPQYTGIDLNRAGTPLLEIVTAPCLNSGEEAVCYLKTLHQLVKFLGICDGNMQEGSFRCDVNISLKPKDSAILGTRTELKNLNSFRYIDKAINYERSRHQDILESGGTVIQETRLYNPETNTTHPMRDKENENDYRYFPDPDLLPIQVTRFQIAEIKNSMPELPDAIYKTLKKIPAINEEDINFILSSPAAYSFYKEIKALSQSPDKLIINWLKGQYSAALNEHNLTFESSLPISAPVMALLLDKIHTKEISSNSAKTIFSALWLGTQDINTLIKDELSKNVEDNSELEQMMQQLINDYPDQVAEYKSGKEKLIAFFVGQIMKQTKGKANPELIGQKLKAILK